jgi:hypothetical protein
VFPKNADLRIDLSRSHQAKPKATSFTSIPSPKVPSTMSGRSTQQTKTNSVKLFVRICATRTSSGLSYLNFGIICPD